MPQNDVTRLKIKRCGSCFSEAEIEEYEITDNFFHFWNLLVVVLDNLKCNIQIIAKVEIKL